MNFMKNPTTMIEWSDGQKFAAEFLGTGTLRTSREVGSISATDRQVSVTIPMQLTPEGARIFRELEQRTAVAMARRNAISGLVEALRPFWRHDDMPEYMLGIREIVFFGKHLKPAPAHIEKILEQREAWDAVYQTCHAKIREVLDEYVAGDIEQSTAVEALRFLCRVCTQACDRLEHYDLCYSLEFTIDEDYF